MTNPTAIVTGAGGGIGAAAARALAPDHVLVLVDLDEEALAETAGSVGDAQVLTIAADVTREEWADTVVTRALDAFETIDGLVNVVGGGTPGRKAPDVTLEEWERVLTLSLTSTFLMCRAVLPHMEQAGRGSIVNISSIAGIRGMHESPAYCAAKGGVIALTTSLALDHGPAGVRVNCVAPGAVATPALRRSRNEAQVAALGGGALAGRVAEPREIAGAVRWLLSDDASYVMGQTIQVDGGLPTPA